MRDAGGMSRKDEDRILHGLHYYRESIDEEFTVTCDQILWLAAHSYADGAAWHKDEDLQSFDSTVVPVELRARSCSCRNTSCRCAICSTAAW